MEYKIVRSNRKTMAIYVKKDCTLEVKAPIYINDAEIEKFIKDKEIWINKTIQKIKKENKERFYLSEYEKEKLIEKANKIIPIKVEIISRKIGIMPSKIRLTSAKSYWGCCNRKHELSFSWRLMLASDATIDYVITHELIHIKFFNHSTKFWKEVEKIIPNYKENKKELKLLQQKYE